MPHSVAEPTSLIPNPVPASPLVVLNSLNISGVNTPLLSLGGQSLKLYGSMNIENGGSLNAQNGVIEFLGTADQYASFNGSIVGAINNLTNNNTAGTVFIQGTNSVLTINSLSLLHGTPEDGSKTLKVIGNVVNDARHTGDGKVDFASESIIQTISGNGLGVFGNVDITNTNPASSSIHLQDDIPVRGTLR